MNRKLAKSLLTLVGLLAAIVVVGDWYGWHDNRAFVIGLMAFTFGAFRYVFGQWELERRETPAYKARMAQENLRNQARYDRAEARGRNVALALRRLLGRVKG